MLQEIHPKHRLQRHRRPAASRSHLRIMRRNQRQQPRPRHHRVHLGEEFLTPRLLFLHRMAEAGKGRLLWHRRGSSVVPASLPQAAQYARFFRLSLKRYLIGFFHIDIAEVQTAEGKLYLFVGIDRTSKFAVAQLVEKADRRAAWEVLQHMLEAVPHQVHTIFTDNGIQFAEQPRNRNTIYSRPMRFDMICEANGIEHRLTKPNHPWTNGQVERMNRTIKDATVKTLPSQRPQSAPHPSRRLHSRLQLRAQAKDPRRPHALRIHLQDLDIRAGQIHPKPDLPDAGTEHASRTLGHRLINTQPDACRGEFHEG